MAAVLSTHALAEHYRVAQAKVATEAAAGVTLAVKTFLNPADLSKSFPAYAAAAGKVVSDARVKAAELGGAFYLAHRQAAGVRGAMPEIAWAPPLPGGQLAASLLVTGPVAVKRAIRMGATVDQALAAAEVKAAGAAYRHTSNGGRGTIKGTAYRDKKALGWARVSDGRPCAFCAMLASRGAVYFSAQTAGLTDDGDKYHDNCGCFVVPVYTHDDPIPGLGPELETFWNDVQKRKEKGVKPFAAWRKAYDEKYPEGSNPSDKIADAQRAAYQAEAAKNRETFEAHQAQLAAEAAREAEKAAKAAAEAAAEAEAIAQAAADGMHRPKPKPADLKLVKTLGGSHGAQLWQDEKTGASWVFKAQADVNTAVDTGTAKLAKLLGMPAADTYAYELGGKSGSLQFMLPGGDAFPGPDSQKIDPTKLSAEDAVALQKNHVLDWLFANHDAHKANFVRDADGNLVGIDKGQALKFFGRDRLDWTFHANEHEPIYNTLYRAYAEGKDVPLLDPNGENELAIFLESVQGMPDDALKDVFRPYAEAAAARGWLLTGNHWNPSALEPLAPGLKPNDVEGFLDALVARKNRLADDFGALWAKARAERTKLEVEAKAAAAKAAIVKKWKGKPAPQPPDKPKPPVPEKPRFLDGWVAKVKARYEAFAPGKKLEDSHNWALVEQVVNEHSLYAVEQLRLKSYIDWDLSQEAADLFGDYLEAVEAAESDADYLKALRSYKNRATRYKRYLAEWREANGGGGALRGMDAPVERHSSHEEGEAWADRVFTRPGTVEAAALNRYTGSDYTPWNTALRQTADKAAVPPGWEEDTRNADAGMSAIPEDVIIHRGTDFLEFAFPDGTRTAYLPPPDPRELVGTVQTQHGYMSTSVGHRAAFYTKDVQLVIRMPAGHKGAYVNHFSQFAGEYELLVERSSSLFIHDVYRRGHQWVVECEILPPGADPASFEGLAPMPRASKPDLP
ncbi:ADP-ribosyltransferase exoenzyme [Micromonospora sp. M71_S20]|uniref:VG15 protein n=1 Tax=Micromonospora sp. M71_S20 TaxID=592872 RepID=UPI000EB5CC1F|nr:ADP-ribosyltransferase [Micromonospora sp. M71_S20]RLK22633.1 ADP-ribosyltransferase exoenzyme [Micromonospora sp. M71_S20]